jgi:histidinol-phosphatase
VIAATWRQRAYGDFWSHCLVAEGAVDMAAEPTLALYDYAALVPIVVESGGYITDFSGDALPIHDSAAHPGVLTTNGHLHQSSIELLS